ncbi:bifunctional DNA primase/polymerase [Paenibacillus qinlingensis]|uniref:bifunctional DNA primase/polymerase n=1 Tax=Paenibacillus qinlingensis TaxID=1837343 RepID=UPI001567864D|nr:bifunctional DNA primase/polymerase [Paenibacillus qinlingensis]NQX63761.1 bifunctional DNA primase/polymerase [Paenibacillus qinlingensis]
MTNNGSDPYSNVPDAMKAYASLGWSVIPLCSCDHSGMSENHRNNCSKPGKAPLIKDWTQRSVPSDEIIDEWVRQRPNLNVGLVLGSSSGIVAIDVDGEFGEELLQKWSNGDLPETCEFTTPGGGRRLMYATSFGVKAKKYVEIHPSKPHEECALLGDGQQTVLPPSRHTNGGLYKWKGGRSPWELIYHPSQNG